MREFALVVGLTIARSSVEFNQTKIIKVAGDPPSVTPPNDQCVCEWTDWMNSDSPKLNDNDTDDEKFSSLRTKGYNICEKPRAVQCWDIYTNTEATDEGEVYCGVNEGLYCDFICSDYAIRVACCRCTPKSVGPKFMLKQDGRCISYRKNSPRQKIHLVDCDPAISYWEWGENSVLKTVGENVYCLTRQGGSYTSGQALILDECNGDGAGQQWSPIVKYRTNLIQLTSSEVVEGSEVFLHYRERTKEIRLHKSTKATSQFDAVPVDGEVDLDLGAVGSLNLTTFQFETCVDLHGVNFGKWDCTAYNMYSSECQLQCDPGYKSSLLTDTKQICTTAGWSGEALDDLQCVPIDCPLITKPENGVVKCDGVGAQTTCVVACKAGYYLDSGPESYEDLYKVRCMTSGHWDRHTDRLICKPLFCVALELDPTVHQDCSGDDGVQHLVGDVCEINCLDENATEQKGLESTVKCIVDPSTPRRAIWSVSEDKLMVCKVLVCDEIVIMPPLTILESTESSSEDEKLYPSTSIDFECPKGFQIVGASRVVCKLTDDHTKVTWSDPMPICKRLECADVLEVERGHVLCTTQRFFNSTCSARCDDGFKPEEDGLISSRCQQNLEWSNRLTNCVPKECEPRAAPVNGQMTACSRTEGSICKVSCDEGFLLNGESDISCNNEQWSAETPECLSIECPNSDMEDFQNGMYLCEGFEFNDYCTFKCEANAVMTGPKKVFCGANGSWSNQTSCNPLTCPVGEIVGEITDQKCPTKLKIGDACPFKCPTGQKSATTEVKCVVQDDQPLLFVPSCEEISCPLRCTPGEMCELNNIAGHGQFNCDGNGFQSTCNYECEEGYKLLGSSTTICGEAGWNSAPPTCALSKCPNRERPRNGQIHCNEPPKKLSCDYICDEGYQLSKDSIGHIICKGNGKWSIDEEPECLPKSCKVLHNTKIKHGRRPFCTDESLIGSKCTIVCNPGYHYILGDEFLEELPLICKTKDNELYWSDPNNEVNEDPVCSPKSCPAFPDEGRINGGHLECDAAFLFNSACRTVCNEGFELENDIEIKCELRNMEMKWSGVPGRCRQITCPTPPLSNGELSCSGSIYGSSCSVICNDNFELVGDPEVTCKRSGTFEAVDVMPSCRKVTCPAIDAPDNGIIKVSSGAQAEVGATAELSCNDGYQIWIGDKKNLRQSLVCGIGGQWDGDLDAICYAIPQCRNPNANVWTCSTIMQNRVKLCQTVCSTDLDNVNLYRRRKNNDVYERVDQNSLQTRCTKSSWDSEKTENWIPDDIDCISSCLPLTETDIDVDLRVEVSCSHEKGIKHSVGSKCTFKLKESFTKDFTLRANFTICNSDHNDAFWSNDIGTPLVMAREVAEIEKKPEELTQDREEEEEEDDVPRGANVTAIVVPILLVVLLAVGFFLYRRKKSTDSGKSKKEYPGFSGLSGGDELDTLLDLNRRPISTHRDSRMSDPIFSDASVSLEKLVVEYEKRLADDSRLMTEEFEGILMQLPNHNEKCLVALQASNQPKNRYNNVIPYDIDRVRLSEQPGDPFSDYINASYIDGKYHKEYIATSAPLKNTVPDFWRMIWEQKSYLVLMLSNLVEIGQMGPEEKSERYWPEIIGDTLDAQDFDIVLERESVMMDFVIRQLNVTNNNSVSKQSRTVFQFHFTAWNDFSTTSEMSLIKFLRKMRQYQEKNVPFGGEPTAPIVVHCSAGCGRAGTLIAIDRMARQLDESAQMDLVNFVTKMRNQRMKMVQTREQYAFIYAVLVERQVCGDTEIELAELNEWLNDNKRTMPGGTTGIQHEFEKLNKVQTRQDRIVAGNKTTNLTKNRLLTILPYDSNRVPLTSKSDGSDYINASFIDGYFNPRSFIATQAPLVDTVEDLWRMIFEKRSLTLISLTDFDNLPVFWPDEEREWHEWSVEENKMVTPKTNEMQGEIAVLKTFDGPAWEGADGRITKRMFQIFSYADKNENQEVLEVSQYHIHGWTSEEAPTNVNEIVYLINSIEAQRCLSEDTSPITVHCSTGAGATGAFIALYMAVDQMKSEQAVDVFQIIKSLRNQRQRSVQTESQYEFVYNGAASFSSTFDDSNLS